MISPVFEQKSNSYSSVCFASVDCDEVDEVSQKQSIRSMPTFILYKNGDEVQRVVGANSSGLQSLINLAVSL